MTCFSAIFGQTKVFYQFLKSHKECPPLLVNHRFATFGAKQQDETTA